MNVMASDDWDDPPDVGPVTCAPPSVPIVTVISAGTPVSVTTDAVTMSDPGTS